MQGRYTIDKLIGHGRTGMVFAGRSRGLGGFEKPVAIKKLRPELLGDAASTDRLVAEATALFGMQHGNIVGVLDLVHDNGDVFLVMEHVDGPSVRELYQAAGTPGLHPGIATFIIQSAAAGLEFAHASKSGLVHADVSSSNILLTSSGEVRVADFGVANATSPHAPHAGRYGYMAPEQIRGERLTEQADVFALGVVLYELLTGRHPLGRQVTATQRPEGRLHIVPPSTLNPSLPSGLECVCLRAMAHERHRRYLNMQELTGALDEQRFEFGWRHTSHDLAQLICLHHQGRPELALEVTTSTDAIKTSPHHRTDPSRSPTIARAEVTARHKGLACLALGLTIGGAVGFALGRQKNDSTCGQEVTRFSSELATKSVFGVARNDSVDTQMSALDTSCLETSGNCH